MLLLIPIVPPPEQLIYYVDVDDHVCVFENIREKQFL